MRTFVRFVAVGSILAALAGGGAPALAGVATDPKIRLTDRMGLAYADVGCDRSSGTMQPWGSDAVPRGTDASSEQFAIDLLEAVSGEGRSNALVSPLGVGAVLAMVAPGAKAPVREAIRELLGVEAGGGIVAVSSSTGAVGGSEAANGRETDEAPIAGDASPFAGSDDAPTTPPGGGSDETAPEVGDPDYGLAAALACRLEAVRAATWPHDGVKVWIANGAFADRHLDLFPSFSAALRRWLGARVERLDFSDESAAARIDAWVAAETGGAIPRLVSRLDPDDVLVLANAMRFEGEWAHGFDPERTVPAPFHLRSGESPEIPTMHADDLPARYREDDHFQALALPYRGAGGFELVIVLPRAGVESPEAFRRLSSDPTWLGGRGFRRTRGSLALPRLRLDEEAALLPALRAMGLDAVLSDPNAFAGIATPPPMPSRVLHRATLELDERGAEAAAATAVVMTTRAVLAETPFDLRVDRPFALALRHRRTGAVLFAAWVEDPPGLR